MMRPSRIAKYVFPWSLRLGAAACAFVAPGVAFAAPVAPRIVEVTTARIHFHDLAIAGSSAMPDVDLGATPPLGSSRTIDSDEIVRALVAAHAPAPPKLPAQVRVVRKGKRLTPNDLDQIVRAALEPSKLPKGATVNGTRGSAVEVPEGFDRVTAEVPAPPRRAGNVTVVATVTFHRENDVTARISVPVELTVSAATMMPDVAKGANIMLTVKRGLVEVSMPGTAAADGDLGGILPVMLKPSGRIVRTRIVDKDHALSIEDS